MSAFRGKADMTIALRNVRLCPKVDIVCRASATGTKKQLIGSLQQNAMQHA